MSNVDLTLSQLLQVYINWIININKVSHSSYDCSAGFSGNWGVTDDGDDAVRKTLGYKKIGLYDLVYAVDNEMHARKEKPE